MGIKVRGVNQKRAFNQNDNDENNNFPLFVPKAKIKDVEKEWNLDHLL
ncbi:hypothetical protein [Gallaecimonas mangrovi]|nr:hypothetical protein [Gallaecimonas mangrovi]